MTEEKQRNGPLLKMTWCVGLKVNQISGGTMVVSLLSSEERHTS